MAASDEPRTGEFTSIGDVIRLHPELLEQAGIPTSPPEPSLDDLLDPRIVPPRVVLEVQQARVAEMLEREWLANRAHWRQELARIGRLLRHCDIRDRLSEGRPPDCWCLGRGWRKPLPHEVPDGSTAFDSVLFCSCAEGERARETDDARRREAERAAAQAAVSGLWRTSGLPDSTRDFTGKSWLDEIARREASYVSQARAILRRLEEWEQTDEWLWLEGPLGTGKTSLMMMLMLRMASRGMTVLYQRATTAMDRIRETYRDDAQVSTLSVMDSLGAVDVLGLDDLGKQKPSEWTREKLYTLLDTRYAERGRRTLFTSNLAIDSEALADSIGEATVERISQRCGALGIILMRGPNLRT